MTPGSPMPLTTETDRRVVEHVYLAATKPVWSILSILGALLLAGFTYWITDLQHDVADLAQRQVMDAVSMAEVKISVAAIKENTADIKNQINHIDAQLDEFTKPQR